MCVSCEIEPVAVALPLCLLCIFDLVDLMWYYYAMLSRVNPITITNTDTSFSSSSNMQVTQVVVVGICVYMSYIYVHKLYTAYGVRQFVLSYLYLFIFIYILFFNMKPSLDM